MNLKIASLGGICPIQADGKINNEPFFFRARGNRWTLGIGGEPVLNPKFFYSGNFPEAGWMSENSARSIIEKTAQLHLQGRPSQTP